MALLPILGLAVVALLVSFLFRRHEARLCDHRELLARAGKGIEIAPICRRLQRVRADYVAVVRSRLHDSSRRQRLHAAARCALQHRAYFRNARLEPLAAPHDEADARIG